MSEWRTYSANLGGKFLPNPSFNFWLITTEWGVTSRSWVARDAGVISPYPLGNLFDVRPSLYVDENVEIVNGVVTFNAIPTINVTSPPSGSYETAPSFSYTVTDADNHVMTVTEKIGGKTVRSHENVESGSELTFAVGEAWIHTPINEEVNVTITADDGNGGVTTVNYPITRTASEIDIQLKEPFEADTLARRLMLNLEGNIPTGAIVNIQACNNAFDASPAWENVTQVISNGLPYIFANQTKTADKCGVSFKIRIERGTATESVHLDGIDGAFD